eukprot:4541970-Prymnesium_polylepis.1
MPSRGRAPAPVPVPACPCLLPRPSAPPPRQRPTSAAPHQCGAGMRIRPCVTRHASVCGSPPRPSAEPRRCVAAGRAFGGPSMPRLPWGAPTSARSRTGSTRCSTAR